MFRFIRILSLTLVAACLGVGTVQGDIPPKLDFLFQFTPIITQNGLGLNEEGDVIMTHNELGNSPIQVYDKCGNFKFQFLTGIAKGPFGVTADSDGIIYATFDDRIRAFDPEGAFLWEVDVTDSSFPFTPLLVGIAVNDFGEIVVPLVFYHRVSVFDKCGNLLRTFGQQGSQNGQFSFPTGVAVNSCGDIIVADKNNQRIQVFDRFGRFLYKIGGQFNFPEDVAVNEADQIIVADISGLQVFDPCGNFLLKKSLSGKVIQVAVNADGIVYLLIAGNLVQVFR